MKLEKKKMLLISFMLFSLFFGAGNLIFPPFLGQCAGNSMPLAMVGFLLTAVILPVLGIIVVAKFGGLDKLAEKVNSKFAIVFTILIYVSIGPGLGIPRAASVPFEMAIMPYLPEGTSFRLFMLIYSLIFFAIAMWLALAPTKLVNRIGKVLTPTILVLLVLTFVSFLFMGDMKAIGPQKGYEEGAFTKGFVEGYQTMDTIAALNFGIVIATTIQSFKVKEKKDVLKYTRIAGIAAGSILAIIYIMLSFMGMQSSGMYPVQDNGAWTLRCIVNQLFGEPGAILLATVFTLACLTTCVGLITSISQYFAKISKKIDYKKWVIIIVLFSFIICNQGLTTILSISVPLLNAIYPISIMLILLGLMSKKVQENKFIYPVTIFGTLVISILYTVDQLNVPLGFVKTALLKLPFYSYGLGWVLIAAVLMLISVVLNKIFKGNYKETEKTKA